VHTCYQKTDVFNLTAFVRRFYFISLGKDEGGDVIMEQVARPAWYPYDGLEAPLGTFVYTYQDSCGNFVARMAPT
jgi:hypothetical protein